MYRRTSRKCFTYGEINGLPPVVAVEGGYINDEDLSEYTVTFMRGKMPTYARNHRTYGRLSAEELTLPQFELEVQAWFTLNSAVETVELCFSETLTSNVSEKDEDEDDSEAMSDFDKGEDFMCESAGRIGDLDSRVLMQRQALDCDPNDDVLLTGLASLLQRRYQETGNQSDIHEAIAIFESLIEIPGDDSVRCSRYNGLGSAPTILFRQTKSMGDLDRAIAMTEKAIQTAPDGWPDKGTYLTNLGNLLIDRFEKERSMYILDWVISTNTIPVISYQTIISPIWETN
jgi:tetratricopeptide (TPR) repeat protein